MLGSSCLATPKFLKRHMPRNKAMISMILSASYKNAIIFLMLEEKDKKKEDQQAIIYFILPCSYDQSNVSEYSPLHNEHAACHGSELYPSICSHFHNKQLR
jgi:hypothetical protein